LQRFRLSIRWILIYCLSLLLLRLLSFHIIVIWIRITIEIKPLHLLSSWLHRFLNHVLSLLLSIKWELADISSLLSHLVSELVIVVHLLILPIWLLPPHASLRVIMEVWLSGCLGCVVVEALFDCMCVCKQTCYYEYWCLGHWIFIL